MFSKLTEAQKQFFETGRTRDLAFRICQLQLLADAMRKNETVLEEALKKDLGKSAFESYATEIGFVLADIRYTIQNLQKWSAPKRVRTPLYLFPGKSKIQKEPYGSVLILGPYNYPVQLLAEPLVGAIAAGNCAVLKPSELTPHVSEAMYQIAPFDEKNPVPSCRNADQPYSESDFVVTVDGFLVSDNVTVEDALVLDTGFKWSDHNPVYMDFILE